MISFKKKLILKKKRNFSLKSKFKTFIKNLKNLNFFEKNFYNSYKIFIKKINNSTFKKVFKKNKIYRIISRSNFFLKKNFFQLI